MEGPIPDGAATLARTIADILPDRDSTNPLDVNTIGRIKQVTVLNPKDSLQWVVHGTAQLLARRHMTEHDLVNTLRTIAVQT